MLTHCITGVAAAVWDFRTINSWCSLTQGGCQIEATKFKLGDRSKSMGSWLSHLKSSANWVCQLEADLGMSGQPEARPLQWGPRGENSLIKFCLASSRLGPLHPHANNLDTLAMAKSGHLCATSASQKTSSTYYNCSQSTQIYRSDLTYRIFHLCA